MQLPVAQFNDHIAYLDNGLLDAVGFGSTYVVRGDELAIVETGTSRCAPYVLDGLRRLRYNPADVRHIVLTHIHMDHAGGTGTLIKAMPEAQVHIHGRSARYLVDPTDLLASAERALGPLFALHGGVEPVPAERILSAEDLRLDLGRGVVLRAIYTPGHSQDHLAYFEESSRSLFTGDAIGVDIPVSDYIGPVTPPPAVNLSAQRDTFEKLRALEIETLLFSHFGPAAQSPRQVIDRLAEAFEQFVALVRAGWEAGQIDHEAILRQMLAGRDIATQQAALVISGWIEMSIKGLIVAFEREAKKARG